jgi:hypothetical protein
MDRKSKQKPLKLRVALVGDGQTERIYIANIKDTDSPSDLYSQGLPALLYST